MLLKQFTLLVIFDKQNLLDFQFFKRIFFGGQDSFLIFYLGFLLTKLAGDRNSVWQFRNFFSDFQNILVRCCFFRFFRANLLSAIKLVGWVRWRAWCLSTPNQSGRKVQKFQHEALCKGLIINKLTAAAAALKSLQKPS